MTPPKSSMFQYQKPVNDLTGQKGLCWYDKVKTLHLERLSGIILVGFTCHQWQGPCKREGDREVWSQTKTLWGQKQDALLLALVEEGPPAKECVCLCGGQGKEIDSPQRNQPLGGTSPADILPSVQWACFWPSDFQHRKRIRLCCSKLFGLWHFVTYSSTRKLLSGGA